MAIKQLEEITGLDRQEQADVSVMYRGYQITCEPWDTTERCIVHSPGKDDYYFDGLALECIKWIDSRIEHVLDSTRREYLNGLAKSRT